MNRITIIRLEKERTVLFKVDKWKDMRLPRGSIKKMKTRWIEKRRTPPHNNQDTFTKKNDRARQKEKKKRQQKNSLSISLITSVVFSFFFSYKRSICIYFFVKYENTCIFLLLFSDFFVRTTTSI
jgi:hypothetical protein